MMQCSELRNAMMFVVGMGVWGGQSLALSAVQVRIATAHIVAHIAHCLPNTRTLASKEQVFRGQCLPE
jgi:hypothetical protein